MHTSDMHAFGDTSGSATGSPVVCGAVVSPSEEHKTNSYEVDSFWYKAHAGEPVMPMKENDYFCLKGNDGFMDVPCSVVEHYCCWRAGQPPDTRLGPDRQKHLGSTDIRGFVEFLRREVHLGEGKTVSVWGIMKLIKDQGYGIWLAGGAVRDILRGAGANDADLSGTIPFGTFAESVINVVRKVGLWFGLNADGHVLYIYDPLAKGKPRILEYAPLKLRYDHVRGHYKFDHDLAVDGTWRDLTINCLYFDLLGEVEGALVFDPTGSGLADLSSLTLRVIDMPPNSPPGTAASRLLRLLKFVSRYGHQADNTKVADFIAAHLDECNSDFMGLEPHERSRLVRKSFYGNAEVDPATLEKACSMVGIKEVREFWNNVLKSCLKT